MEYNCQNTLLRTLYMPDSRTNFWILWPTDLAHWTQLSIGVLGRKPQTRHDSADIRQFDHSLQTHLLEFLDLIH